MAPYIKLIIFLTLVSIELGKSEELTEVTNNLTSYNKEQLVSNALDGVYTECLLYLSYSCLQRKTLSYLKELDSLSEVSVVGDFLKFVKINNSTTEEDNAIEIVSEANSEELSRMIENAVDKFFNGHVVKISALGRDIMMPNTVEEFVGRKRKGGGGGGGGGGGHGGHDGGDGGKKKMMMMAMMCMKMKMMMMIPAMMGMMGMMSFKGMMFSMMSFMISKMMLLMKLLEKKNSFGGGGGGGGADQGWAAGGGGGAWMPAGPDYGGGGGGYDSNAQWQQRSIMKKAEKLNIPKDVEGPVITYIKPGIRYNGYNTNLNEQNKIQETKSRKKRGVIDMLQNAYMYWMNKMLGVANAKKYTNPKFKVINGMKYVYYPRPIKTKAPKELYVENEAMKPIIIVADDFNKGEIVDVESRMIGKKVKKFMKNASDIVDDNPWD